MAGPRSDPSLNAAPLRSGRRRLAGLLALRPLGRLDAWLRLHHPLVWRTRVHFFLWYGLILGNLLFLGLGWVYPLRLTAVPSPADIVLLVSFVAYGVWTVLCVWALLIQCCSPLPETGPRGHLLTLALYWVCILCVVLIPHSFARPLVYRIADLAPEPDFAREYAFHKQYNFWCCHPALDEAQVSRHEDEIRDALRRYGQGEVESSFVVYYWPACPSEGAEGLCMVGNDERSAAHRSSRTSFNTSRHPRHSGRELGPITSAMSVQPRPLWPGPSCRRPPHPRRPIPKHPQPPAQRRPAGGWVGAHSATATEAPH